MAEPFLGLDAESYGLTRELSRDVTELDLALGEILPSQEGQEFVKLACELMDANAAAPDDPEKIKRFARAFTVLFQLINAAEQKEIVRVNRARRAERRNESIAEAISGLKAQGKTAE